MSAVLLLLCDTRTPLSDTALPPDSVVELPLKRDALRRWARAQAVDIAGEVVMELEPDVDHGFLVDATVHRLEQAGADRVLSVDRRGLEAAGLYAPLLARAAERGLALEDVGG